MLRVLVRTLTASAAILMATRATARSCDWLPGEGVPGTDGQVWAMTTWDPDGPGPQPELLIAGGNFSVAGEIFASNIAAWNGSAWQALGTGFAEGSRSVNALMVYNGELIAGGGFHTSAGVQLNHIARWDGVAWQPLGSGMDDDVNALSVYDGELIAGGSFTMAGAVRCRHVARWNGSSWQPLGEGMDDVVMALAEYNGDLVASGSFTVAGGVSCSHVQGGCVLSRFLTPN
jgi:hypothetical protein